MRSSGLKLVHGEVLPPALRKTAVPTASQESGCPIILSILHLELAAIFAWPWHLGCASIIGLRYGGYVNLLKPRLKPINELFVNRCV
jgi:hypothetical protein